MNTHIHVINNDVGTLAEDAPALMIATSEVPTDKIVQGIAFDGRKKMIGRVYDKAVEGAMTADQSVHEHPYETIGIAFGVAALIGFLLARRDGN